jgi:hypothetical protein
MTFTAQNPQVLSQEAIEALRATLTVQKDGRSWVVRDSEGNILITRSKKAGADAFVSGYTPEFTTIATSDSTAPIETQPQPENIEMTEDNAPTTDLPVINATLVLPEVQESATAPTEATEEPSAPLTEEEQAEADKKASRSQKLREAMAKVLAAPYDPNKTHPSYLTKRGLHVTLPEGETQENLPAVLHHRAISSFSDKSLVDGVTFMGMDVPAARTRGTWRGVKTSFLWIEAPRLAFPSGMVGGSSKDTVTFHILVENDDWDSLEGAAVTADFPAEEPASAAEGAKKAPWDKPTPTDSDEGQPAPAKREHPQAESAQA